MKTYLQIIIAFAMMFAVTGYSNNGNIPKLKDFKHIKYSKVIIGLTGNEVLNGEFKKLAYKHWRICVIETSMPIKRALRKAKKNDSLFVIYPGSKNSDFFAHALDEDESYNRIKAGKYFAFSNGSKTIFKSYIPAVEHKIRTESIVHGLSYMQEVMNTMLKRNLEDAMETFYALKHAGPGSYKDKTLYIPEMLMNKDLTDKKIKDLYTENYKVVPYAEWKNAIMEKDENIVYLIVVPVPYRHGYTFEHRIINANNGGIYGVIEPKCESIENLSKKEIEALAKTHQPYINEINIRQYSEAISAVGTN